VRRQNDKREERTIFMGIKPISTGLTLQDSEFEYSIFLHLDGESSLVSEIGSYNDLKYEHY